MRNNIAGTLVIFVGCLATPSRLVARSPSHRAPRIETRTGQNETSASFDGIELDPSTLPSPRRSIKPTQKSGSGTASLHLQNAAELLHVVARVCFLATPVHDDAHGIEYLPTYKEDMESPTSTHCPSVVSCHSIFNTHHPPHNDDYLEQ